MCIVPGARNCNFGKKYFHPKILAETAAMGFFSHEKKHILASFEVYVPFVSWSN